MKRAGYLMGLRSFVAKKSGNECYVIRAALSNEGTDPHRIGCFDTVDVFVEKGVYDRLKSTFKPFQPIDLEASIGADRVFWNLAS